ncbi:unnamed protein product [Urochloa humidicola]
MATPSRLLAPAPPPAPSPRCLSSIRVAVPRVRCRASAAASPAGGATLLERDGAAVALREFVTLNELHAAVRLRVRTFYEYALESVGADVIVRLYGEHWRAAWTGRPSIEKAAWVTAGHRKKQQPSIAIESKEILHFWNQGKSLEAPKHAKDIMQEIALGEDSLTGRTAARSSSRIKVFPGLPIVHLCISKQFTILRVVIVPGFNFV